MAGHKIDIAPADAHVTVRIDGIVVAKSSAALTLHETGYPIRHYLPRDDVRLDLLTPTDTRTHCPFKGDAEYWSFQARTNVAWSYPANASTRCEIADLICFDDDRVEITCA